MQDVQDSPPRAPPIQYTAPLGTRWEKEKAAAGGSAAFDLPTDPKSIGPWILGECIGKGASGRVKIARHHRTRQLAAVKILPIAPLVNSRASLATQQAKSEKQRLGIDREITMMKLMNHPNIMRIYDVYEGERELFLVLEYVEGGELFDFLVNRGRLPPNEALVYFRQIIYGLNYAHTFSIIHRDLKPENILIASLNPPVIKIADWGMAAFAPPMLQLETSCGSPHYASPEIVNGEKYYGTATDIWSCGVILYALLTGRLPFDDKNVRSLLSKVKSGKYEIPSWIDPLARDLLTKMLVVDVRKRITIPDVLKHPWFLNGNSSKQPVSEICMPAPPPLPPSPSTLARPIASPDLIDPELFASLRIIWGRHADPQGTSIQRDLCSPAGHGLHAKAFYFLLDKYREESLRNRTNDTAERPQSPRSDSDCPPNKPHLGWDLDQSRGNKNNEVNMDASPRGDKVTAMPRPAETTARNERPVLEDARPKEPVTSSGSRSTQTSRLTMDTRRRQVHSYSSSSGTTVTRSTVNSMNTINYPHPLPAPPKRGYTHSGSRPHPQPHEQRRATDPLASGGIPSPPDSPNPAVRSGKLFNDDRPTLQEHQGRTSAALSPTPIHASRMLAQSTMDVDAPLRGGVSSVGPHSINQVNDMVFDISETALHSSARTRPELPVAEKENASAVDDGWTHVETEITRPRNVAFGLGVNREVGREMGNNINAPLSVSHVRMKKDKERKSRPPPIELPPVHHRRALVPTTSPAVPGSTNGTRISASPVVGEFKGWFSNLFNWKGNAAPPSCVLYSSDDLSKTRESTLRLFQSLTFGISRVILDINADNSEIYHCRLDQTVVDSQHYSLKPVRLRVEFSLVVPASPAPMVTGSDNASHAALSSPSPHYLSTTGLRARNSVALGRTISHNTPSTTPLLSPHWELPPGCACVIMMSYEKGSASTFRLIRQRLRDMFADSATASLSPCISPNTPNTAFSDIHQRSVV